MHPIIACCSFPCSYKNGAMTRELIRNRCAGGKWEEFNRLLEQTEPGNQGNIGMCFNEYAQKWTKFCPSGIYFTEPEITPSGHGQYRFDQSDKPVDSFSPAVEVRALVEGQIMAKLSHARRLGYQITPSSRVLVTGGTSQNSHIRQASKKGM